MLRFLPIAVVVLLMIFCVVEVAQADGAEVRRAPRWLWAAAVICLPGLGSVLWLLMGRPNRESIALAEAERQLRAPDDDPDFLRGLH